MIRTQIQLEEGQYRKLKSLAAQRSQSIAQLVREGVDRILSESERRTRWEQLEEACGSCRDPKGRTDVSEEHDKYLADAYSHE